MTEEEYYNQFLYGGWDPHAGGTVWLENGAYAQLERDLAYYRLHPNNVQPDELLRFLAIVLEEWKQDRIEPHLFDSRSSRESGNGQILYYNEGTGFGYCHCTK